MAHFDSFVDIKISNRWMFLMDALTELARNFYKTLQDQDELVTTKNGRSHRWRSAKQKIAPTTTHGPAEPLA